ncbi:MAG: hypothetical protein NC213_09305 [Acetobacter sp.]|nr:hypothetical protein [Bacteroides sp.]MCM1341927.1 hypothetical protein [Acetobacter sp.]MCM1434111.1 hypothetical protein [Clostridiales bacterium]
MNIKTYYFSYGGTLKKIFSKILMFILHVFYSVPFLLLFLSIFGDINVLLKNTVSLDILNVARKVEVIVSVLILCVFIIQPLFPQKVQIYNNSISIYRHTFSFWGFNDTVLISDIENVYISKNHDMGLKSFPVGIIDWDNLVIIESSTRRLIYRIPVENSDDFIKEVTERVNIYRKENSLEEI